MRLSIRMQDCVALGDGLDFTNSVIIFAVLNPPHEKNGRTLPGISPWNIYYFDSRASIHKRSFEFLYTVPRHCCGTILKAPVNNSLSLLTGNSGNCLPFKECHNACQA